MDKKRMMEELGLTKMAKNGERMLKLSQIWKALAFERFTLLEDVFCFLQWYYSEEESQCPYSRELVIEMANNILSIVSAASDKLIEENRRNYNVLEVLCKDQVISSFDIIEIVKIMDYLVDHELI